MKGKLVPEHFGYCEIINNMDTLFPVCFFENEHKQNDLENILIHHGKLLL